LEVKVLSIELYTNRLYLRKVRLSDSLALFKIWSDPDVTRFMNITSFTTLNQAEEMIGLFKSLDQDNKAIRFTIIELESGKIIGSCGFNYLDFEHEKAEIGYELSKAYWGRGYATEAIHSLLEYAFINLRLNRIEAKVVPQNLNSIKVLSKLNFKFEGTLRQSEKAQEKFHDINVYSLLKTD